MTGPREVRIDHRAEAVACLRDAERLAQEADADGDPVLLLRAAQVHASLAVADEIRELREKLEELDA